MPSSRNEVRLKDRLSGKLWMRQKLPFEHFVGKDVFSPAFYADLEKAFLAHLARGLSDLPSKRSIFSRNMGQYDAYSYNFPTDIEGPLAIFYSRQWHDLLAQFTKFDTTLDVNGALHHHRIGSANGNVHRDLTIGWFSHQPRDDGVNPMDLDRCSYTVGKRQDQSVACFERVRCVAMIFFLANAVWAEGDGGETALYASKDAQVEQPVCRVIPQNNSILVFEINLKSWHSFLSNTRHERNSVILWLHTTKESALSQFGDAFTRFQ